MKKIFLLFFMVAFGIVCGSCLNATQQMSAEINEDLSRFVGTWETEKLLVTPRVALVESKYAKENSNFSGQNIIITETGVKIAEKQFYLFDVEMFDHVKLSAMFNITYIDAETICGGCVTKSDSTGLNMLAEDCSLIKAFSMRSSDGTHVTLFVNKNDKLLLWVSEEYTYVGFYPLTQ